MVKPPPNHVQQASKLAMALREKGNIVSDPLALPSHLKEI